MFALSVLPCARCIFTMKTISIGVPTFVQRYHEALIQWIKCPQTGKYIKIKQRRHSLSVRHLVSLVSRKDSTSMTNQTAFIWKLIFLNYSCYFWQKFNPAPFKQFLYVWILHSSLPQQLWQNYPKLAQGRGDVKSVSDSWGQKKHWGMLDLTYFANVSGRFTYSRPK